MNAPERIYIDERASRNLPIAPEEVPGTGKAIGYIREDIVKRQLAELRENEFVVQIQSIMEQVSDVRAEYLCALTNYGRIFERKGPDWVVVDLPEFET